MYFGVGNPYHHPTEKPECFGGSRGTGSTICGGLANTSKSVDIFAIIATFTKIKVSFGDRRNCQIRGAWTVQNQGFIRIPKQIQYSENIDKLQLSLILSRMLHIQRTGRKKAGSYWPCLRFPNPNKRL
jgi:hypothetical protein